MPIGAFKLNAIARAVAAAVAASAFTHDANTLLLLHMDGTDASTTFIDYADRDAKVITTGGNAQIDTAQSKFGGASLLGDGAGDYLQLGTYSDLRLTGDFTVECWYRIPSTVPAILPFYNSDHLFYLTNDGGTAKYALFSGGSNRLLSSGITVSANTWYHFAMVRSGTTVTAYHNGVSAGSATWAGTIENTTPTIGSYSTYFLNGWIDEFRVSKTARYTSNFTAPSYSFVNDANTLLLIHANGTDASTVFTDDTGRALNALTAVGNAQIDTADKKFGTAAALFDGNGDYITIGTQPAFNFGKSDFTIEAWVKFDLLSTTNRHTLISNGVASFTTNWIKFSAADLGAAYYPQVTAYNYSSGGSPMLTSSVAVSNNTWYHVAYVRYNTDHYLFLNGTQVASNSTTTAKGITVNFNANNITQIGRYSFDNGTNPSSTYFDGWVDELRISNIARYSTTFTPGIPTTAPTITHNAAFVDDGLTKLLLHFENNVTDDNSSGRTAVTGLALADSGAYRTDQKKFGTYSIGSTSIPGGFSTASTSSFMPGTSDFTLEFWFRPAVTANTDQFSTGSQSNGSLHFLINTDTGFIALGRQNVAWDVQYTHGALSAQWYHVAFVKTGGFLKVYLNGDMKASAANAISYTTDNFKVNMGGATGVYANMDEFRISHIARYTANFTVA